MLKHVATAIFGLCLLTVVINGTVWGMVEVYIGAVVIGSLASVVILWEKKDRKPAESQGELKSRLTRERDSFDRSLQTARSQKALDRVTYFEQKLAEVERQIRKLDH
jgi:hypothetical protein